MQVRPESDGFIDDETGQVPGGVEVTGEDGASGQSEDAENESPYASLPPYEEGDTQIILSFSRRTGGMAITVRPEIGYDPLLLLHMLTQAMTSVVEHQAHIRQQMFQQQMAAVQQQAGVRVEEGPNGLQIHTDINVGETRRELSALDREARLAAQRAANPGRQTEVKIDDGESFTINDRRKV